MSAGIAARARIPNRPSDRAAEDATRALVPRRQRSEIAASSLGVTEEAEQNGPSLGGAVQMAETNVHRKFLVVPWGTLLEFPIPRGSKITKVLLSSNRDITIDQRQQLITPK